MADQTPPAAPPGPVTAEGLFDDRQRFWSSFTGATTGAVVAVAALLIGMALFLL